MRARNLKGATLWTMTATRFISSSVCSRIAAQVFGYQLYQERQKTTGIEINVGKSGISIEKKK